LGDGTGTFVKVVQPLQLKDGYIVSFGESHMAISISQDIIKFKFLEGPKCDQEYSFSVSTNTIKVGRSAECEIKFDDNSLSRYQCCINYVNGWTLKDGFTKPSTNGTWLYVEEPFPISDEMLFKVGQTLFNCEIIRNK
jgi:hypothetical protein